MNKALQGFYEVATGARAVFVRVHGLASMNNCLAVRDFIEEMLRANHSFIVVDLSECTGMDSTFMGVLAGAATCETPGRSAGVAIVNAGEQVLRLLRSVGLTELIFVEPGPFEAPKLDFVRLEDTPGEEERLALVRSAHERLIKISEKNEKKFGPFLEALEEEMRHKGMLGPA